MRLGLWLFFGGLFSSCCRKICDHELPYDDDDDDDDDVFFLLVKLEF